MSNGIPFDSWANQRYRHWYRVAVERGKTDPDAWALAKVESENVSRSTRLHAAQGDALGTSIRDLIEMAEIRAVEQFRREYPDFQ